MALYNQTLAPFELKTAVVLITGGRCVSCAAAGLRLTLRVQHSLLSSLAVRCCAMLCLRSCSSGIGLALCDEFLSRGSRVLITGRREAELQKQQAKHGKDKVLAYYVSNQAHAADREALFKQVTADHPDVNVVINNAGIQRRGDHRKEVAEAWAVRQEEIDINLSGPIHLTSLFIPYLISRPRPSAIINVTSGLAFVPFTAGPVYSATKAALHQYTLAVRPLLQDTQCRLVEMIPPAVKSNLGGVTAFGEDPVEFSRAMVDKFAEGKVEFGYKSAEERRDINRQQQDQWQQRIISQMPPPTFGSSAK